MITARLGWTSSATNWTKPSVKALSLCLRQDLEAIAGMEDLAGYTLVAWGKDGRPAVFPRLFGPGNPVPAYVLPAYLQIAIHWWIEDGMPGGFKPS